MVGRNITLEFLKETKSNLMEKILTTNLDDKGLVVLLEDEKAVNRVMDIVNEREDE